MSRFRFLHAADIHLDSPLSGLAHYQGAPAQAARLATRDALTNMVRLAIDQAVDFVVIAGDLYDGSWPDQSTGLFFAGQMSPLRQAGIPVFVIRGNHDAESRVTEQLKLPDNVQLLPGGQVTTVESEKLESLGVKIYGHSYRTAAEMESVLHLFPVGSAQHFNIGILHTALEGSESHARYAPCSVADLKSKEYQYWALGHVHTRQIVSEDPPIVYPGNIQGRHVRETMAKGCYTVDVDEMRKPTLTFHTLDVVRWFVWEIDVSGMLRVEECRSKLFREVEALVKSSLDEMDSNSQSATSSKFGQDSGSSASSLAVRLNLVGQSSIGSQLHQQQDNLVIDMRAHLTDVSHGRGWLESVRVRTTSPANEASAQDQDGPFQTLCQMVANASGDTALLELCREKISELVKKLPAEVKDDPLLSQKDDRALLELIERLPAVIQAAAGDEDG